MGVERYRADFFGCSLVTPQTFDEAGALQRFLPDLLAVVYASSRDVQREDRSQANRRRLSGSRFLHCARKEFLTPIY
jgi:hypothetical protein